MEKVPNNLLHGKRVLVVEDDALAAFDIMKTLRDACAEILVPAMSVARALEFATEDFDCAVLDVVLRDGAVFGAARLLHEQGVKLVFYTGHFDLDLNREWPDAQVLIKPATPDLLVQAVRAACSQ
jgi:DNA-binding response OmpR family regulator